MSDNGKMTMWKSLLRWFGIADREELEEHFDPIYGLPYPALNEWLSRNPQLQEEYDAELTTRLKTRR